MTANLSIFDKATGRPERAPETALGTGNVSLSPAGQVAAVSASTALTFPRHTCSTSTRAAAWASTAPRRWPAQRRLPQAFVAHLGANDYVRLRTFDVATNASIDWLNGNDPALVTTISKVTTRQRAIPISRTPSRRLCTGPTEPPWV